MPHRGGPRLLVTDRQGALFIERARIHVDDGRVVYVQAEDARHRAFAIPHVNLAVLFMGQGTSITDDALRLLGEEHVHVAATGSGGTPLHMGALTTYQSTRHFRDFLPVYLDEARSLAAAKAVMAHRGEVLAKTGFAIGRQRLRMRDPAMLRKIAEAFRNKADAATSIQELLGHEGQFAKSLYATFAKLTTQVPDFRRRPGDDGASKGTDPAARINGLIDHGNYLCYGMAGAALWAVGIPPHMSVFHGKTRPGGLVFDVADGFKDALVLPLAFAIGTSSKNDDPETQFRTAMIDAFDDHQVLATCIALIERMIDAGKAAA